MLAYRYTPFSKPLHDLTGNDLDILQTVSEGWFVDYKSEPVSIRDFAKHMSAFANQFGGWLFIGVAEGPNKNMKAASFPGIPTSEVGRVLLQLREAVSAHVSPSLYFEYKVIDGPVPSIGLSAERSIITIGIPEGQNPPYVHSSGRIYRRLADSSDPKPEADRAVLDSMWRKSEDLRIRLRDFILKPAEDNQTKHTYCYVYLLTDLTLSGPEYGLDYAGFKEAMTSDKPDAPCIPLDNIYPTQDGFIARQVSANDPLYELVNIRWWRNGNVRLTIPVNYIQVSPYTPVPDDLIKRFLAAMGNQREKYRYILNLDQWLAAITSLTVRYLSLRDKLNSIDAIYGKIVFSRTLFSTPFIGMESYLKTVERDGIPVVQDSVVMFPADVSASRILKDDPTKDFFMRPWELIAPLVMNGMTALGVILNLTDLESFGRELATAFDRGATGRKKPPPY